MSQPEPMAAKQSDNDKQVQVLVIGGINARKEHHHGTSVVPNHADSRHARTGAVGVFLWHFDSCQVSLDPAYLVLLAFFLTADADWIILVPLPTRYLVP